MEIYNSTDYCAPLGSTKHCGCIVMFNIACDAIVNLCG